MLEEKGGLDFSFPIEKITGMSNRSVCRAQKSLVSKMILVKKNGKLSFNKHYNQWVLSKMPVSKIVQGTVKTVLPGTVKNDRHNIYITKDTYTKEDLAKNREAIEKVRAQVFKKLNR